MKIAVVGCGYVFDHYMATMDRHPSLEIIGVHDVDARRTAAVSDHYGLRVLPDLEAVLASDADAVVNLTSIESHEVVTRAALEAGKHVYSEKPLTTDLAAARELVALAESKDVHLSCAPSNALSPTSRAMAKAVRDGAIGDARIVYAEFDDNPIPLMAPETWRSRTGAPWPYLHEYEMGCTWEHVGYHLTWMCAILGPVRSVTAFSKQTAPDKTEVPLDPADTPDFSVAVLDFASGAVGRVTCSIGAPLDHRMRIIGGTGMIQADTYRHYECPVFLEPFTTLSLNARKARSVRTHRVLQRPFGVGGRSVPLPDSPDGRAVGTTDRSRSLRSLVAAFRRRELGQQDKAIGIAELADAVSAGRTPFPSHDFTLHLTELTLAIQAAGPDGATMVPTTTFDHVGLPEWAMKGMPDYRRFTRERWLDRLSARPLTRLHRH